MNLEGGGSKGKREQTPERRTPEQFMHEKRGGSPLSDRNKTTMVLGSGPRSPTPQDSILRALRIQAQFLFLRESYSNPDRNTAPRPKPSFSSPLSTNHIVRGLSRASPKNVNGPQRNRVLTYHIVILSVKP